MRLLLPLIALLFFNSTNILAKSDSIQSQYSTLLQPKVYVQDGYDLSRENQDAGLRHFEEGADYYERHKDTVAYLECILGLSELAKRSGRFNSSFEIMWDIRLLAEKIEDKSPLVQLHRKIGVLYGIYGKDSLALQHMTTGLSLAKKHLSTSNLPSAYLPIANYYLEHQDYDNALLYLDSCYLSNKNNKRLTYIDALYGHIYTQKEEYSKASEYLHDLIPIFKGEQAAFLARVYYYHGDLAMALDKRESAIDYFEKSLEVVNRMRVHIELKPIVLERLAHLYQQKGNMTTAYRYMEDAKLISDSLFHMQSVHNKTLFEIKNKYQEDVIEKEEQLVAQKRLLEMKDKASLRLKMIIGILVLLVCIGSFAFRQRFKMKQMLANKAKNEDILSLRNKELTSNALQIIEKEQSVNELLEIIKENIPTKHKLISSQHRQDNKKIWEDFHLRFTQTNNQFYERLLELHPSLTPTDLKHCALIKLKFDSKEMSHILGISLNSVHMARYRVRKKLKLEREESLSNYIAKI